MGALATIMLAGLLTAIPQSDPAPTRLVDAVSLLRQSAAGIQVTLGPPVRTRAVPPGDFQLPMGGYARLYRHHGATIDVDFANERSTTIRVSFLHSAAAPRTYEAALEAIGLRADSPPDLARRSFHEWQSLDGYVVQVVADASADHIDAVVLSLEATR
ncbi:MAG TPA: hypothetical protein VF197_09000 [Methylomirabilota bacterium]|jgi:hypothetical protein